MNSVPLNFTAIVLPEYEDDDGRYILIKESVAICCNNIEIARREIPGGLDPYDHQFHAQQIERIACEILSDILGDSA